MPQCPSSLFNKIPAERHWIRMCIPAYLAQLGGYPRSWRAASVPRISGLQALNSLTKPSLGHMGPITTRLDTLSGSRNIMDLAHHLSIPIDMFCGRGSMLELGCTRVGDAGGPLVAMLRRMRRQSRLLPAGTPHDGGSFQLTGDGLRQGLTSYVTQWHIVSR